MCGALVWTLSLSFPVHATFGNADTKMLLALWRPHGTVVEDDLVLLQRDNLDTFVCARIKVENPGIFSIASFDDASLDLFLCRRVGISSHRIEHCLWQSDDRGQSMADLRAWHRRTFSRTVLTMGNADEVDRSLWYEPS